MTPLCKIVLVFSLCLFITPSLAFEEGDDDVVSEVVVLDADSGGSFHDSEDLVSPKSFAEMPERSSKLKEKIKIKNEPILEEASLIEAKPETTKTENRLSAQEPVVLSPKNEGAKEFEVPEFLKSADPHVLGAVGIKRLSKGISIFRFSSFYLKHYSSFTKNRTLPENAVQ